MDRYTEEQRYAMLKKIDHAANRGGNLHIDAHGVENIPSENGFIFYPNHQGLYDVLAILDACPIPFSVVAKKEVGNVPFLKQVFTCMKAFIIDREGYQTVYAGDPESYKRSKSGKKLSDIRRGTRSKDGNHPQDSKVEVSKQRLNLNVPLYR